MMENMDINRKILSAIQSARPLQLWGLHAKGYFILSTGVAEERHTRTEVVEILNRERATLEVKASMIQSVLDLVEPENKPITEILVDIHLFESLVLAVINAKSIREFPEDVRVALEETDRIALDQAVKILNRYKRKIGEEEIH